MEGKAPAITWPLWRRIRFFGGMGVVCGALVIAMQLLIADIPGQRAFNEFTPGGAVPLWPAMTMMAIFSLAAPIAVGVCLPLYRHRRGWVAIASIVYLILLGSDIASGGGDLFSFPEDPIARLQKVVALVGTAFLVAVSIRGGRSLAIGQGDDASGDFPSIF